ncbi:hypothetical protein [Lacipirellula limnantheis]|uniref:Uncharacterized protein n=1 Tax=Lacipirellula limnantheis TaxID=2528024 RepID=A0A517U5W3_9BACT|nr:hypothetical protein [Lacipirellula limnantheis]QDT76022.1 hypothetical protein I41_52670 [Lacipirellula limnantheis]
MKAQYRFNGELGHVEGCPRSCVNTFRRLAREGEFQPDRLFANVDETAELGMIDQESDILNGFALCLDESIKPTVFSKNDFVTLVTYRSVKEDNMHRTIEFDNEETAGSRFDPDGGGLPDAQLFEEPDLDDDLVSYGGAAGTHNAEEGLDLPTLNWNAPVPGQLKPKRKGRPAPSDDDEETGLDLMEMKW